MTVADALRRANDEVLPLRVREVLVESTNFVVSGADWNLMVMCPMRYRTPAETLGWESKDLEDRLWSLIGLDLTSIGAVEADPVFWFGDRHLIEVFADTDLDPWVLRLPGLVLVGAIPDRPTPA